MKTILSMSLALVLGVAALPALAQSSGSAPVAGEGPGGSGAGQSSAGPSKTPPAAPAADGTMKKTDPMVTSDPAKPAGTSTTN